MSDKPSFMPREPLDEAATAELTERYRDRLTSLLSVDDLARGLLRTLRKTRSLHKTLIIFTSDNGWLQGEHRLTGKLDLYEESARVPLILRGPGIPKGAARDQLVGNIDLAPTILAAARARPLTVPDGRPLQPLARHPRRARGRDLLLENRGASAVRTGRFMYAEHESAERELYDLRSDPFQLESRHVGGPHETVESAWIERRVSARLDELVDCAGATCR